MFPWEDRNIDLCIVGNANLFTKHANSTLVPMVLTDIYRALTNCKASTRFFEGCNLLLQMWLVEHLCHHPRYMTYRLGDVSYIEEYESMISGYELLEGIESFFTHLCSLTASQSKWSFSWLSVKEVIYMSTCVCFLLSMDLWSVRPYTPHQVLRQLGRYQTIPHDDDLST